MAVPEAATFVFTDLVGSTALAASLDREQADELRHAHFEVLRTAIAAAGGIEVKNLGDGLMVRFTSPTRALACAVGMQQGVERHNRRLSVALSIRVGVATGEAIEEDGDFFGDPVVEAARLCAAAEGGQILTTDLVRQLVGRHAAQELVVVGPKELKGIPEPVVAVEVRWEPAVEPGDQGTERVPFPAQLVAGTAQGLFAFFGRSAELAQLETALKETTSDRRARAVLIGGEPGIGKTALAAQAARAAHASGAAVIYGSSSETLSIPYRPWMVALSHLCAHTTPDTLRQLSPIQAGAIARLLPEQAGRLPAGQTLAGDPDVERVALMDAVVALLATASAETPLIIILDDVQWADLASLELVRHVLAAPDPLQVLLVATLRDSELGHDRPLTALLADLHRQPRASRLHVSGLDDTDIVELIEAAAGYTSEEAAGLAHALRRETSGNAFFVTELLRHLAESGAITPTEGGRYGLAGGLEALELPRSVREVIGQRVARLGPEGERALALAAVLGQAFDLVLLAGLSDITEDQLLDLLDAAGAAALVVEDPVVIGRYRFAHALVQHTLYQGLSVTRRQRTHQRVAELLESAAGAHVTGPGRTAALAQHWIAATTPMDATKAVAYARRAGDEAIAALAPQDAIGWYERALELLERGGDDEEAERGWILASLGDAQRNAGRPEHRDTLREAGRIARRLMDTGLLVRVALSRSPGFESTSLADPDRMAVIEAALDAVGPPDTIERARLLAALTEETDQRDVALRVRLGDEAIAVARRVGDDATLLSVITLVNAARNTPDTLEQRIEDSATAVALAARSDDPLARLAAYQLAATVAIEAGDLPAADFYRQQLSDIADHTGLPHHRWLVLLLRGARELIASELDEAERTAQEAFELGTRMGISVATTVYGAHLVRIYCEQGRLDELIGLAYQAAEETPSLPGWRPAIMFMLCQIGRLQEASELFDQEIATGLSGLAFDITWLQSMSYLADCACDLGKLAAAPGLYERMLPYRERFIFVGSEDQGAVARPLGRLATLLGRFDEAESHLRYALDFHRRLSAPFWIARTQVDLAAMLVARRRNGDLDEAGTLIDAATVTMRERGYGGLTRAIADIQGRL